MSISRNLPAVLGVLLIIFLLFGCANGDTNGGADSGQNQQDELKAANEELKKLLPEKEGFRWIYNGFAEYGHTMELERIQKQGSQTTYFVSGNVEDLSGGESTRDFSLEIEYVIKDGILAQKKKEELMLDSISNNIQLAKTPLEQGAQWKQTVTTKDGDELNLDCQITEVTEENRVKEYTIIYEDQNSDYFERRKIREGTGVVSLEKMLKSGGESFVAGYYLYEEASGYRQPES
ncbi:MAG TPA: hypothetical protein GX691_03535 [Clostridia bacterium]|nr:hypothetical protein [Clostridia bacterium]